MPIATLEGIHEDMNCISLYVEAVETLLETQARIEEQKQHREDVKDCQRDYS